jgi:hypothetical protein
MSDRSDDDVSDPETDSIIERAVQSIESARKGKSQPHEVVTITEPVKVKKPRKPPTPAMLAALAKGREKRLESAEISRLQRLEILRERRLERKVGGRAPVEISLMIQLRSHALRSQSQSQNQNMRRILMMNLPHQKPK